MPHWTGSFGLCFSNLKDWVCYQQAPQPVSCNAFEHFKDVLLITDV